MNTSIWYRKRYHSIIINHHYEISLRNNDNLLQISTNPTQPFKFIRLDDNASLVYRRVAASLWSVKLCFVVVFSDVQQVSGRSVFVWNVCVHSSLCVLSNPIYKKITKLFVIHFFRSARFQWVATAAILHYNSKNIVQRVITLWF